MNCTSRSINFFALTVKCGKICIDTLNDSYILYLSHIHLETGGRNVLLKLGIRRVFYNDGCIVPFFYRF